MPFSERVSIVYEQLHKSQQYLLFAKYGVNIGQQIECSHLVLKPSAFSLPADKTPDAVLPQYWPAN
jgi:hypothetical protein